jgi:hypothetical protein
VLDHAIQVVEYIPGRNPQRSDALRSQPAVPQRVSTRREIVATAIHFDA